MIILFKFINSLIMGPCSCPPSPPPHEPENNKELFKVYETERLILERTKEMDYYALSKIMFNKKVNHYYKRPILSLETIDQSLDLIRSQTTSNYSFTIKLKDIN